MKKILLSTFAFAVAISASAFNLEPSLKNNSQHGTPMPAPVNVKPAPKDLVDYQMKKFIQENGSKTRMVSPPTKASDMEGCYSWTFESAPNYAVNPDDVSTSSTQTYPIMMYDADDAAGTFKIAGLSHAPITVYFETDDDYPYFFIDGEGVYYYTSYGVCDLKSIFYFEGNASHEAGWYSTAPAAWIMEENGKPIIVFHNTTWMYIEVASGSNAGYLPFGYFKPSSFMVENNNFNGVMESVHFYDYESFNFASPVAISENQHGVVTINNFSGILINNPNPVKITLQEGRTWTTESTVLFTTNYDDYVLYGTDGDIVFDLTGTGTDNKLFFDTSWTALWSSDDGGWWLGLNGPSSITYVGDKFVYPKRVGDLSGDGIVDIDDVNALINIILTQGNH